MDFVLFLLVNAVLFLRPQDLFPSAADVPFYNIAIISNLVVAIPAILGQFRRGLQRLPATLCVVGVLTAIVVSLLARGDLDGAWEWGVEFLKVLAYFVLMTAVLTSARRFTIYLASVVVLTIVLSGLSIADFQGRIDVPAIEHVNQGEYDKATGEYYTFYRLCALGMFADPNDLSMIVVLSILVCLGGLTYKRLGAIRFTLLLPIAYLGYALALTQSRGGLLALLAGVAVMLLCRYGFTRSTVAIAVLVPALMVVFGGRQADIGGGISHGTGNQRTELWYVGLQMIKWSPVFGMGHKQFVKEEGYVAHNTYIQALAEWGPLGGMSFIGLFYIVLYSVWRLRHVRRQIASPPLRLLQPYVMGALAAYAVSIFTLSRGDVVPTYLVAGLGVSYESLARRGTMIRPLVLNSQLLGRIALATAGFVVLLYIYIRFISRMF
jgi:putative inorganic carbon (hco3(-)) transporter